MHIPDFDVVLRKIFGKAFSHLFGKSGDQDPSFLFYVFVYLRHEIVYLSRDRSYLYLGIEKSGRSYKLFDDLPRLAQFVRRGGRGYAYHLPYSFVEFLKSQRSVVIRGRQSESVFDKVYLSRAVAVVHCTYLRQSHVAFVNEKHEILGKKVEKRIRRLPGLSAVKITGIVLYAAAIAHLSYHLDVIAHPFLKSLSFEKLISSLEIVYAFYHIERYLS